VRPRSKLLSKGTFFAASLYKRPNCFRNSCHPIQIWLRRIGLLFLVEIDFTSSTEPFRLGLRSELMCPVSQSNSCWQSLVGMFHVCRGGSTPNWLNRESESGMLISEMYFQCPSIFLIKELGRPYQVSFFPVGFPNTGWGPR